MSTTTILILTLMVFVGVSHAQTPQLEIRSMPRGMENQGPIQSMNLGARTVTINGIEYPFHPRFEIVRHTPEGVERVDPRSMDRNAQVAVEQQEGTVLRLHILE